MKRTGRPKSPKTTRQDYPEVSFLKQNWPVMLFIVFVANFAVTRSLQLHFYAQSCMTVSQVQSDSRCLYIWSSSIYQMGTKNNPHMGNPCGSDVTSIIPNSHTSNMARYLDPRLISSVCSSQPTPTATPIPQATNTPMPQATNTPPPTGIPQPTATSKPNPTATTIPQPTATLVPGAPTYTPTPYRSPTPTQMHAVTNTPTKMPTQKPGQPIPTVTPKKKGTGGAILQPSPTLFVQSEKSGFGKYITYTSQDQNTTQPQSPSISLASIAMNPQKLPWQPMVIVSQLLVVASFIVMVISFVLGFVRKR